MNIYDINKLTKDSSGNYDLTQTTFQLQTDGSVKYSTYIVQAGEEMRIDLVCNSIYGNSDSCDILLNVNEIDNPLNIKEGSILIYPVENLDGLRYSENTNKEKTQILANSNKSTRKDKTRNNYQENNLNLPPTILEATTNQFDIETSNIVLGKGLF